MLNDQSTLRIEFRFMMRFQIKWYYKNMGEQEICIMLNIASNTKTLKDQQRELRETSQREKNCTKFKSKALP